MGGNLGWRKQGSPKGGDVEASVTQPLFCSTASLPKRSVSEGCFSGLASGYSKTADDESVMRPTALQFYPRGRCKQLWASHSTHICLAFTMGVILSCMAFSFSMGFSRSSSRLHLPKVIEPGLHCKKHLPAGIALTPLAIQNLTASPSSGMPDKLIVAARHSEDTSWLDVYLSHIPHVVYQVDDPENTVGAQHATLANKGNEAMAYLQFIIDYYDRLPASIVFVHGHRSGWHLLDVVPILQRIRWGNLAFAPLRYKNSPGDRLDWKCGSRTDDPVWRQFDCNWEGAHLRPGNFTLRDAKDVNEVSKDLWIDSLEMSQVWPQLFQDELGDLPSEMQSPCCSTFMVQRERILAHSLAFYIHLRDWILKTEMSSYRTGRMMEYTWHIMFGEQPVMEAVPECELLFCDKDGES